MELEQNMASLVIHEKKRRLSGFYKPPKLDMDSSSSDNDADEPSDEILEQSQSPLTESPVVNEDADKEQPRRSLRKRLRTDAPEKRRVVTRPKKSDDDIENYYLDKRVKRLPPSLETIFEEPQVVRSTEVLMSTRKFKRVISFNASEKNSTKIKKRKMKAKSVSAKKKVAKKLSLELLIQKLSGLDEEN